MATIIPFIIIILSLTVIIVIIVRKFPHISLLDVDTMPEVKNEKKKMEYIKRRINKNAAKNKQVWEKRVEPLIQKAKQVQLQFRKYVGAVEKNVMKEKEMKKQQDPQDVQEKRNIDVTHAYQDGVHALEQGDIDTAEKQFIEAIRLDPKRLDAYRGLADVYVRLTQYQEAEQTYMYILKLDPHDDITMMKLGELLEEMGKKDVAVDWYQKAVLINPNISTRFAKIALLLKDLGHYPTALEAASQAVELEPQNPKYLDNFIELSIMSENLDMAEQGYAELRIVNPDNQKLRVFKERIMKLKEKISEESALS